MFDYKNKLSIFNRQDYNMNLSQEYLELIIYSFICFLIPFLFGHSQWIMGVLVNATLILSALNLRSKMLIPAIMLPSLAVLASGIIFDQFTHFLVFMIPFIWIGNTILVYSFKKLKLKKKMNSFIVLIIGGGMKTLFLFSAAFILYKLSLIPAIFLTTMGLFQLYTVITGGILALGIHSLKKKISLS